MFAAKFAFAADISTDDISTNNISTNDISADDSSTNDISTDDISTNDMSADDSCLALISLFYFCWASPRFEPGRALWEA